MDILKVHCQNLFELHVNIYIMSKIYRDPTAAAGMMAFMTCLLRDYMIIMYTELSSYVTSCYPATLHSIKI